MKTNIFFFFKFIWINYKCRRKTFEWNLNNIYKMYSSQNQHKRYKCNRTWSWEKVFQYLFFRTLEIRNMMYWVFISFDLVYDIGKKSQFIIRIVMKSTLVHRSIAQNVCFVSHRNVDGQLSIQVWLFVDYSIIILSLDLYY